MRKMSVERFIGVTSSFRIGKPHSDVVVVLKKAKELLGFEGKIWFYLKIDDKGRLIYEPLKPQPHTLSTQKEVEGG